MHRAGAAPGPRRARGVRGDRPVGASRRSFIPVDVETAGFLSDGRTVCDFRFRSRKPANVALRDGRRRAEVRRDAHGHPRPHGVGVRHATRRGRDPQYPCAHDDSDAAAPAQEPVPGDLTRGVGAQQRDHVQRREPAVPRLRVQDPGHEGRGDHARRLRRAHVRRRRDQRALRRLRHPAGQRLPPELHAVHGAHDRGHRGTEDPGGRPRRRAPGEPPVPAGHHAAPGRARQAVPQGRARSLAVRRRPRRVHAGLPQPARLQRRRGHRLPVDVHARAGPQRGQEDPRRSRATRRSR